MRQVGPAVVLAQGLTASRDQCTFHTWGSEYNASRSPWFGCRSKETVYPGFVRGNTSAIDLREHSRGHSHLLDLITLF